MPDVSSPAPQPTRRPRVAVVVGSGGIKCTAAIGMWKVLERNGIKADLAVGCSGGSLLVAQMALGVPVEEAEKLALRLWPGLFERASYRALARSLVSRWFGFSEHFGVVDDAAVNRALDSMIGDARFGDTRMPLYLTATGVYDGQPRHLHHGLIRDAARASIAIPPLLRPWRVDGELLMDGGTSDPLPVSVAIREGADIILAMGFESPPRPQLGSALQFAGQTMSITINHLLRSTYAFYSAVHHAELVPLMPDFGRPIRMTDTDMVPHIIEQGERVTEAELPYIRRLLQAANAEPRPA